MPIQTTNDTVTDIKFERGVRRLQEMKAENKKGRVTFYVDRGIDHGKVSELEIVVKE